MVVNIIFLFAIALLGGLTGYGRSTAILQGKTSNIIINSQPIYHAIWGGIFCFVPAAIALLIIYLLDECFGLIEFEMILRLAVFLSLAWLLLINLKKRIKVDYPARDLVEKAAKILLFLCAIISILITISIVLSVLFEAIRFFKIIPASSFLFGSHWSPQSYSVGREEISFGALSLFIGTLLITSVAMLIAVPIGLFAAIYMSEYASAGFRNFAKPVLEVLAGIPTVVYGYFAVITIAPMLRNFGVSINLDISSESALAAGVVMGIMIIPFISSLSDDVISAVPKSMHDAALGLGATKSEMIKQVILPCAMSGIIGSVLLGVSRAIGETMIVVMAAGLAANLTFNPLQAVTTVTAQIVSLLVGDQEFDSAKTLVAFALGLTLFVITLVLNIIALIVVKKYRVKYDG